MGANSFGYYNLLDVPIANQDGSFDVNSPAAQAAVAGYTTYLTENILGNAASITFKALVGNALGVATTVSIDIIVNENDEVSIDGGPFDLLGGAALTTAITAKIAVITGASVGVLGAVSIVAGSAAAYSFLADIRDDIIESGVDAWFGFDPVDVKFFNSSAEYAAGVFYSEGLPGTPQDEANAVAYLISQSDFDLTGGTVKFFDEDDQLIPSSPVFDIFDGSILNHIVDINEGISDLTTLLTIQSGGIQNIDAFASSLVTGNQYLYYEEGNVNFVMPFLVQGNSQVATVKNIYKHDTGSTNILVVGDGTGDPSLVLANNATSSSGSENFGRMTGDNVILSGAGSDTLFAGNGTDTLIGAGGSDRISGGGGNDILDGGAGDDILDGGDQDDIIVGGTGNDAIVGDNGNDQLFGDADRDILVGSLGDDTLTGGSEDDVLSGAGDDDDYMFATSGYGKDVISDADGDIFINGVLFQDTLATYNPDVGSGEFWTVNHSTGTYTLTSKGLYLSIVRDGGTPGDEILINKFKSGTFNITLEERPSGGGGGNGGGPDDPPAGGPGTDDGMNPDGDDDDGGLSNPPPPGGDNDRLYVPPPWIPDPCADNPGECGIPPPGGDLFLPPAPPPGGPLGGGGGGGSGGGGAGGGSGSGPLGALDKFLLSLVPPMMRQDPLVLDLDGDGLELLNLTDSTVFFDMDNDALAERTGWVKGDDGLLAVDADSNGQINNISELFGDENTTGFLELASYDTNNDNIVDASDTNFTDIQVWQDANEDGITDAGELQSLTSRGITAISTAATSVFYFLEGNNVIAESTYTINGEERDIFEVLFQLDNGQSVDELTGSGITIDPETVFLPVSRGYGDLHSLTVEMSINSTLRDQVNDIMALGLNQFNQVSDRVTDIMYEWAGVAGIDPDSRGGFFDARTLTFLEEFTGIDWQVLGNPNPGGGGFLQGAWDDMHQEMEVRLLVQGPLDNIYLEAQYDVDLDEINIGDDLDAIITRLDAIAPNTTENWDDYFWLKNAQIISNFRGNLTATDAEVDAEIRTLLLDKIGVDANNIDDYVIGTNADDTLSGQASNEFIYGGSGADSLSGNGGNDVITGEIGDDTLFGDQGDDSLKGDDGNDLIYGGSGDDTSEGGNGDDTLAPAAGDDVLDGSAGNDQLNGATGSDIYIFARGNGNDTITDTASDPGDVDTISLASDLLDSDIRLFRDGLSGSDLQVIIDNTGETLLVSGQFTGYGVETIRFGDNTEWDLTAGVLFEGTAGNDDMFGHTGDDTLDGKAGNDTLNPLGGNNIVIGGLGDDSLEGGGGSNTYQYALGDGNDSIATGGAVATHMLEFTDLLDTDVRVFRDGLSGNDLQFIVDATGEKVISFDQFNPFANGLQILRYSDGSEVDLTGGILFEGGAGDDDMFGYTGDDTLKGFAGNDTLNPFGGNNVVIGGLGDDSLEGGGGNNTYQYASGDGNDIIATGGAVATHTLEFTDLLDADIRVFRDASINTSDLQFIVDTTGEIVTSSFDFDPFVTGIGKLRFSDGSEMDFSQGYLFEGDENANNMFGSTIADTIIGNGGDDTIASSSGNDSLVGNAGNDILNGGGDTDIASYSYLTASGVNVNLTTGTADAGTGDNDTLSLIENIIGSDQQDTITGDGFNNQLEGKLGNDIIDGASGDDTLNGDNGNDSLLGQAGADSLDGGNGADTLEGGAGNDTLIGGTGTDSLEGGDNDDSIEGNDGADTLRGGNGNDFLTGQKGLDTLYGGEGDDTLYGGKAADELYGEGGNDLIFGDKNDGGNQQNPFGTIGIQDSIWGGDGNDTLRGEGEADQLNGEADSDILTGGSGKDEFIFTDLTHSTDTAIDTITDFEQGDDRITLTGLGITGIAELTITNDGTNTTIDHNFSTFAIKLNGVFTLTAADFEF